MNDQLRIPLTLTVAQVNQVLTIISEKPYKEVDTLIHAIKTQGDAAIVAAQKRASEQAQTPPAEDPPANKD